MSTTITTPAGSILPADDNVYQKVPLYNQAHLELEQAIFRGPSALSVVALSSPYTMSAAESRGAYLESTGVRGSALTQIVNPAAVAKHFTFFNNGTTQTITVKVTSGGTGITVSNNTRELLTHDGTNVYKAGNYTSLSGLTAGRIQRALTASTIGDGALSDDGTNIAFVSSAAYLLWSGRSQLKSSADGNILLQNNAATSFDRLQLGGTSSAFPSLKRSGQNLLARLADDSAYTPFEALALSVYNGAGTTRAVLIRDSTGVELASGFSIAWSNSATEAASAKDTDLTRVAAAVIKAGNGSTGYAQVRVQSLGVNNSAAATTPGSVVKKIEVFDAAGASLGFLPVYSSIA